MTTAQELKAMLKPLVEKERVVFKDHTNNAWANLVSLMQEAALANCGQVDVYMNTTKDQYGIHETFYNYSAQTILTKLKDNGYEVEELVDHTDAIVIRITWDKTYPLYKNTMHRGNTYFYLKDT